MGNRKSSDPSFARLGLPVLLCASLLLCGCSDGRPPAYPAHGKVVFPTGSPVHVGTVELKSREHGVQARGMIQPDGTFVLSTYREGDGAVAGKHDAVVVQLVIAEEVQGHRPSKLGVVHPRYARYATSGLEVEIKPETENALVIQVDGVVKMKPGDEDKPHGH